MLALRSVDANIQFMDSFRYVYCNPFVEVLLLASVTFQVVSGIYLIKNRWGQRHGSLSVFKPYRAAIWLTFFSSMSEPFR
jgi:hypothetical protein